MHFLSIFIIPIVLLAAIYTGIRLYGFLKLFFHNLRKLFFWGIYLLFPFSLILSVFLPVSALDKFLTNIGFLYASFLLIAVMILVLAELIRFVLLLTHKLPKKDEQKRKAHITVGLTVCLIIAFLLGGGVINEKIIDTTTYDVSINKTNAVGNLKIVEVADIHLGYQESAAKVRRMVESINAQNPDIVFFVGDTFNGSMREVFDLNPAKVALTGIKSKYGVFACLGNHDLYTPDLDGFFVDCNITLLKDEAVLIQDSLYVVGRNDRNLETGDRGDRKALSELLKDADKTKPVIVLDHRPDEQEDAVANGADLLLCGHSHAGQTFPITLITKQVYELDYGIGKFGDMTMIVTSGAGLWGPPARIGTDSEIVAINMSFE